MPKTPRAILTILSAMACAACATSPRVEVVRPPVALTSCADEPLAPDLPGREQQVERDRLTFDYILAMRSAWGDCSAKVAGIKAWSDSLGD